MLKMWQQALRKGSGSSPSRVSSPGRDSEQTAQTSGTDSDRPLEPLSAAVPLVSDHLPVNSATPMSSTRHRRTAEELELSDDLSPDRPTKRLRIKERMPTMQLNNGSKNDSVADYLPEYAEPAKLVNQQLTGAQTHLHGSDNTEVLSAELGSIIPSTAAERCPARNPAELVVFYDTQPQTSETSLFKRLLTLDPQESIFKQHFKNARHALSEIGPCASDLVWRRALKDIEASTTPVYEEDDEFVSDAIAIAKIKVKIRNVVRNSVFAMPNLDPMSRGMNVTPKFIKLVQILKACEADGPGFRGVVFVQRRCIAFVIVDLLRTLDDHIGFLRPQVMTGHGLSRDSCTKILEGFQVGTYNLLVATKSVEDMEIGPASIVVRFDLFDSQVSYALCRSSARHYDSHLVHMAEKGNDIHRRILSQVAELSGEIYEWVQRVALIPESAIPPSPLQETNGPYRSDSDDEDEMSSFIKDPTTNGKIYPRDACTVLYRYVSSFGISGEERMQALFQYEVVESTSKSLPTFNCTILFPAHAPTANITGQACTTKSEARRSACYLACSHLFERGLLDHRFFPKVSSPTSFRQPKPFTSSQISETPANKEEDESVSGKSAQGQRKSYGIRSYPRKKPEFWNNTLQTSSKNLYPAIIVPSISPTADAYGPFAPVVLLTRLPLPPISEFNLFFSGIAGSVSLVPGDPFQVDEERMQDLYKYTCRIFRAVLNKPMECSMESMAYFLCPLPVSWQRLEGMPSKSRFPRVVDDIQWDVLQLVAHQIVIPLKTDEALEEDCMDALIQDRWAEFTRRYYCVKVRRDMSPMSEPGDSLRERGYDSLFEYCKVRRKGFEGLKDMNQPLIEVSRVPLVLNHLNPASKPIADAKRHPAKYLIPELCAKVTIPASILRTSMLLPSIMRRVDDVLLVKELNAKVFNHAINERQLHIALSAPSSAVEFDYERLELLGDAYLKYLSSIYLFVTSPAEHEGTLHIARQQIISNKSLLYNAERCGLPQYIQSRPFTTKTWLPLNFSLTARSIRTDVNRHADDNVDNSVNNNVDHNEDNKLDPKEDHNADSNNVNESMEEGEIMDVDAVHAEAEAAKSLVYGEEQSAAKTVEQSGLDEKKPPYINGVFRKKKRRRPLEDEHLQWLGDKGVADVAEAIIGAAYISGGREVALRVTKALNVPVSCIDQWSDFGRKALAPPPEVTAKLRDGSIEAMEAIVGHQFRRPHLLAQALTHSSIQGNNMTCYERLEFIGDAILDFLVIRYIYNRDCKLCPGGLTLLKGAMVSNTALAALSAWSGLHEHLLVESYILAKSIRACVKELSDKRIEEDELATQECRLPGQYWLEIEPPKALSDVIESVMGALYVSDNFSPVGAEKFFDKVLKPFYDRHIRLNTLSHHPTKVLFELFQARGCQDFSIDKEQIHSVEYKHAFRCDVIVHDTILASATDSTSSFASRKVSLYALDALEGDSGFMSRTCDCRDISHARRGKRIDYQKEGCSILEKIQEIEQDEAHE